MCVRRKLKQMDIRVPAGNRAYFLEHPGAFRVVRCAAAGKHKEKKIRSRLLSHFQWRLRGKEHEIGK
jgi:hypothetical protein